MPIIAFLWTRKEIFLMRGLEFMPLEVGRLHPEIQERFYLPEEDGEREEKIRKLYSVIQGKIFERGRF